MIKKKIPGYRSFFYCDLVYFLRKFSKIVSLQNIISIIKLLNAESIPESIYFTAEEIFLKSFAATV